MPALIRFLNSPQPPNISYVSPVKTSVYISVFVAVFLVVFQPFGLGTINSPHKILIIASYGLPCLPPDIILGYGLVYWFRRSKSHALWKVWHELVVILLYIVIIGASNYTYSCLLFGMGFRLRDLLSMETYTALVAFFPAVATFVSARAFNTCRNETAAESLNRSLDGSVKSESLSSLTVRKVTLSGENKDESVTADLDGICFIKSDGNYVEVVLAAKGAKHETRLLRATLKDMETQLAGQCTEIVRCHRSYLVNKQRISSAEGNAMGLTISLDRDNLQVPVSRSYVAAFKA